MAQFAVCIARRVRRAARVLVTQNRVGKPRVAADITQIQPIALLVLDFQRIIEDVVVIVTTPADRADVRIRTAARGPLEIHVERVAMTRLLLLVT